MTDKKLTFKVESDDKKVMVAPRWRKAEDEHTRCPDCGQKMVVVLGHKGILYGFCFRCLQYYLP